MKKQILLLCYTALLAFNPVAFSYASNLGTDILSPMHASSFVLFGDFDTDKLYVSNSVSFGIAYPNPTSSSVSFDYAVTDDKLVKITIVNVLGTEVYSAKIAGQGKLKLSTEALNEGVYFYTLYIDGAAVATKRLMIRR
jgi:Secretion system C-terminal sorting domain